MTDTAGVEGDALAAKIESVAAYAADDFVVLFGNGVFGNTFLGEEVGEAFEKGEGFTAVGEEGVGEELSEVFAIGWGGEGNLHRDV